MSFCISGRVPPRLVYLWSRIPGDRLIQVVFEWEAPWPEKYVIECHEGRYIVARSPRLTWQDTDALLNAAYVGSQANLVKWYSLVFSRIGGEGGSIEA